MTKSWELEGFGAGTAPQPLYDFDELRGKCHMFRSSQAAVDFWALRLDLGGKHGDMVLPPTAKEV